MLKVTVGLPVYNDAEGLKRSIPSVMNQSWDGEIELLVVDDGSTDATPEVLRAMQNRHPGLRVVTSATNRGRAHSRNRILDLASSDYLAWIDADDIWYPDKLALQFSLLRARPDDLGTMCTCSYDLVLLDEGRTTLRKPKVSGDQLKNFLDGRLYPFLWSMLARTQTFHAVGRFDESLRRRQDYEFMLRFVAQGGRVVATDPRRPLCAYYRTDVQRSGWQVAASNRRIWSKHSGVFKRYGRAYALKWRATQHRLTARFFLGNGKDLPGKAYDGLARLLDAGAALCHGASSTGRFAPQGTTGGFDGVPDGSRNQRVLNEVSAPLPHEPPGAADLRLPDLTFPLAIDIVELDRQRSDSDYAWIIDRLHREADRSLSRGPYSVVDKQAVPPPLTLHDYWCPAPYWWPNPNTLNGRPFVKNNKMRQPGTRLCEEGSDRYDRTRLQQLCDDTLVLALAHLTTGRDDFANHARHLVCQWFLDEQTRMTPHLEYAEVRLGHSYDRGSGRGIIHGRPLWYLLDGIRILIGAGAFSETEAGELRKWFAQYLGWLRKSRQGRWAKARRDFHGVCYDLQTLAISAFLGAQPEFSEALHRAEARVQHQTRHQGNSLWSSGASPHQKCITLQAWTDLHHLTRGCGRDLWEFERVGREIRYAMKRLLQDPATEADAELRSKLDAPRLHPLHRSYDAFFGKDVDAVHMHPRDVELVLPPDQGVRPFWILGAPGRHVRQSSSAKPRNRLDDSAEAT